MDGRNDKNEPIMMYQVDWSNDNKLAIKLGHSCDEWVIGSIDEAKAFVKQLEDVISRAEANPEQEFTNET